MVLQHLRLSTRRIIVPLPAPVSTSFDIMGERFALLVSLMDAQGQQGIGEVFANWSPSGAMHRENLLHKVFAPLLAQACFDTPTQMMQHLQQATHRLRLQCDEPGLFDQCLAGLDIAVCALLAQRQAQTLSL
jgi:D-galactarolactone cycloisomerase